VNPAPSWAGTASPWNYPIMRHMNNLESVRTYEGHRQSTPTHHDAISSIPPSARGKGKTAPLLPNELEAKRLPYLYSLIPKAPRGSSSTEALYLLHVLLRLALRSGPRRTCQRIASEDVLSCQRSLVAEDPGDIWHGRHVVDKVLVVEVNVVS